MKTFLTKTEKGVLIEALPSDGVSKLKIGETYEVEIKLARNYLFHKKFFALVKLGSINTKLELPFDVYRKVMIMKAGYFKAYNTGKGIYYEADSIAFDQMTEEKFQEVYSRVLDKIIEDIGADKELFEKELSTFI
jgi:hypothetical protein